MVPNLCFFLTTWQWGKDDPDLLEQVVTGISSGCEQSGCALIGGETAIMPDIYQKGDYDVAGFCVGVVEKSEILDGSRIRPDDVLLGVSSSGFHSNGYSLIRQIVFELANLKTDQKIEALGETLGDVLLRPTHLYAKLVQGFRKNEDLNHSLSGIAHVTGGGLVENVTRILPNGISINVRENSWLVPPAFSWLQQLGEVDQDEMHRVFNMGIGLVLVVRPEIVVEAMKLVHEFDFDCFEIGTCEAINVTRFPLALRVLLLGIFGRKLRLAFHRASFNFSQGFVQLFTRLRSPTIRQCKFCLRP